MPQIILGTQNQGGLVQVLEELMEESTYTSRDRYLWLESLRDEITNNIPLNQNSIVLQLPEGLEAEISDLVGQLS